MMGTLTEPEIDALLAQQQFGHLGCCSDGKPYVFPMAYAFHHDVLYGQTTEGSKVEILRRNPHVCFQVQDVQEDGWRSVQCWGTFEELDFESLEHGEASRIVRMLSEHLGSMQSQVGVHISFGEGNKPSPMDVNGKLSTLFRIIVREKSGVFRTVANSLSHSS